jgi:hypothetical protein
MGPNVLATLCSSDRFASVRSDHSLCSSQLIHNNYAAVNPFSLRRGDHFASTALYQFGADDERMAKGASVCCKFC